MRVNRTKSLGAVVLSLLFAASAVRAAEIEGKSEKAVPRFHVEGVVEFKGSTNGEPMAVRATSRFKADIAGCRFRIDELVDGSHPFPYSFYHDGTNWYHFLGPFPLTMISNITRMTVNGPVEVPLKTPKMTTSPGTLAVSPVFEAMLIHSMPAKPLWLAFAGGCYYAQQRSSEAPPFWTMGGINFRTTPDVRMERTLSAGGHFVSNYTDYWEQRFVVPPDPDCNGLTNIVYSVTGWTNLAGVEIPIRFTFVRHYYNPSGNPKYFKATEIVACVKKISELKVEPSFTPVVMTNSWVVHYSSSDNYQYLEPITYVARDGRLKSQEEVDASIFTGPPRTRKNVDTK